MSQVLLVVKRALGQPENISFPPEDFPFHTDPILSLPLPYRALVILGSTSLHHSSMWSHTTVPSSGPFMSTQSALASIAHT